MCASGVCAPPNATDASVGCTDDSAYEPNETTSAAYSTGLAQNSISATLQLSICPASQDQDHFRVVTTTANQNLEANINWNGGGQLQLAILNSTGSAINQASPMPGYARAYSPLLPVGTYYVRVLSSSGTANYTLNLTVTNP